MTKKGENSVFYPNDKYVLAAWVMFNEKEVLYNAESNT
jgi:hypothetical protein